MLRRLQRQLAPWVAHNFGDPPWTQPFMGVVEEVGELSHALLKQEQGIRGAWDDHEDAAKDAVGDVVIFLACLCHLRGWDLESIVENTWAKVQERDWKARPSNG